MPKLAQIYKILLVDDDPFSLDVIVEFLDGEGYCLFLSASGEEALEKLIEPNSGFDILGHLE